LTWWNATVSGPYKRRTEGTMSRLLPGICDVVPLRTRLGPNGPSYSGTRGTINVDWLEMHCQEPF
jgi:hypothetical protein